MNDFDQVLELRLRQLLDPVVATRPPVRGLRSRKTRLVLAAQPARVELAAEAIPVLEPVVLPVAAPRLIP